MPSEHITFSPLYQKAKQVECDKSAAERGNIRPFGLKVRKETRDDRTLSVIETFNAEANMKSQ